MPTPNKPLEFSYTFQLGGKQIKQIILDEYPYKISNSLMFNMALRYIQEIAMKINDMDYLEAVRYVLNLLGNTVLPNSIEASLEYELFKLRYFKWSDQQLKDMGIKVE